MSDPYSMFETDEELESGKGITVDYGKFQINVTMSGGRNKKHLKALAEKYEPVRDLSERGLLSQEENDNLILEAFVEGCVVSWSGVTDRQGKKIPFNKKNAIKLLSDLPHLYADLKKQSVKFENFKKYQEEVEIKN